MKCEICEGTGTRYLSNFGGDRHPEVCDICHGSGRILTPAERLIVAADFRYEHPENDLFNLGASKWTRSKVIGLADSLKGTGVYLKVNSALRAWGYDLIDEIHDRGLKVFADLKLCDISNTLADDGVLLREAKPELLTTVCVAGVSAMRTIKSELPDTEVLGVTVLTSMTNEECSMIHGYRPAIAACKLAELAKQAGLGGIISSAKEACEIRKIIGSNMSINTPAIRPTWAIIPGDDQNPERIMTPVKAIRAGADRIVVGRPITQAKNPYDAVMRTIEEIASVM